MAPMPTRVGAAAMTLLVATAAAAAVTLAPSVAGRSAPLEASMATLPAPPGHHRANLLLDLPTTGSGRPPAAAPGRGDPVPPDSALRLLGPDVAGGGRPARPVPPPPAVAAPPDPAADSPSSRPPPVSNLTAGLEHASAADPPAASPPPAPAAAADTDSGQPVTVTAGPDPAPAADPPAAGSGAGAADTKRMVTIPLGQSRPWPLDYQATAVFAADPEVADVRLLSPEVLYVVGKGLGRTSIAVLNGAGRLDEWLVTIVLDLEPIHAVLAADPVLHRVGVHHLARGVTLTGEVESVAAAERAQRLAAAALPADTVLENDILVTAPQQVSLEVQIAEVQRSVTEFLGISWEAFNQLGDGQLLWRLGRPQFQGPETGLDPLAGLSTGFVDGEPTSSIFGRYVGSRGAVQGVVDALASAGLANVLARPNLTAISGESASFFAGGEYPLPAGFRDGVIVFEYKKYGVLLDFVPTVVDRDRITLTVRPEVSEASNDQSLVTVGTEIPVINVRRAETTVEIGNGESIVIAGLFRAGSSTSESGLPGLKDLPVFGQLFRRDRIEASETELIVVVTANLVGRADRGAVAEAPLPAARQVRGYYY